MAPGNSTIPQHLLDHLRSPQTSFDSAVDALEEWILHRRSKGDTLFEVSVGLAELEDRTPPSACRAFDRARYVTNTPQPSDLTPPVGPFPLARSASPATILHHLLSSPTPTIQHSREIILEYVLAKEGKFREKKPGRGGKGTLGRDGFEEISKRLSEVEDGLRGAAVTTPLKSTFRGDGDSPPGVSDQELDEPRKIGLALILSLRMSLSYFTLQQLADQLLLLALPDAERTLVQHIRRRVQGEGRYGVGKELEYVEQITSPRRPALRPVFRSAKTRTCIPQFPRYPINLPAPSKSSCIKLLLAFAKDVDTGTSLTSYTTSLLPSPFSSPSAAEKGFLRRGPSASPHTPSTFSPMSLSQSPKTSLSALPQSPPRWPPPPLPPQLSPTASALPPDPDPLASFATELISEFITREKRESLLKLRWAKTGRDQLSKDLADIESSLCISSRQPSARAPTLLPVFLLLRRTFALPPCPLNASIIEPYIDNLPAPPDSDEEPFREPTVQTTTVQLYVNPRLSEDEAFRVLEELVESERENAIQEGLEEDEISQWITLQIKSVQKRFPDGSYDEVFADMMESISEPPAPSTHQTPQASSSRLPAEMSSAGPSAAHRRTQSSFPFPAGLSGSNGVEDDDLARPQKIQHLRSASMPMRRNTYDDETDSSVSTDPTSDESLEPVAYASPHKAETILLSKPSPGGNRQPSSPLKIDTARPAPTQPPMQSQPQVTEQMTPAKPASISRSATGGSSSGGWWDVVSAVDHSTAPWHASPSKDGADTSRAASISFSSPGLPLPPGAEPAQAPKPSSYIDLLSTSPPSDASQELRRPPNLIPAATSTLSFGSLGSKDEPNPGPSTPSKRRFLPFLSPRKPRSPDRSSEPRGRTSMETRSRTETSMSPTRLGRSSSSFDSPRRPHPDTYFSPSNASPSNKPLPVSPEHSFSRSLDVPRIGSTNGSRDPSPGMINFSRPTAPHMQSPSRSSNGPYAGKPDDSSPASSSLAHGEASDEVSSSLDLPATLNKASLDDQAEAFVPDPIAVSHQASRLRSVSTPLGNGSASLGAPRSQMTAGQIIEATPGGSPRVKSPVGKTFPSTLSAGPTGPSHPPTTGQPRTKLFNRSISLASKGLKRGKENEKLSISGFGNVGKKDKDKAKGYEDEVANNPGKWNKDMVANIMGPPVDRR